MQILSPSEEVDFSYIQKFAGEEPQKSKSQVGGKYFSYKGVVHIKIRKKKQVRKKKWLLFDHILLNPTHCKMISFRAILRVQYPH